MSVRSLRRRSRWLLAVSAAALALAACGGEAEEADVAAEADDAGVDEAEGDDAGEGEADGGLRLETADSDLGTHLVDGEGMTVYLFTPDEAAERTCTGGCAETWPPVPAEDVEAGDGVDESLTGATSREDGSQQLTYDGWPLYYFSGDEEPGVVAGQGVNDAWFVVSPDGEPVDGETGGDGDTSGSRY